MSLKSLINNQTLIIDDHKWGAKERKNWDKSSTDIHIDKKTKYQINGKTQFVRIRIPINSERNISVESKKDRSSQVPNKLKKEIRKAFEDINKRNEFIKTLIPILENFSSNLDSLEKAESVLKRI